MDMNESIEKLDGITAQFKHQCLLVIPLFNFSNIEKPTYRQGTKQIDIIMCSQNISKYIKVTNIQPYNIIYNSDAKAYTLISP